MGITTTIPTNLNFPNRGVLERDDFVNAQETAQDLLAGAYTAALNQYAMELNDTKEDINLKWEQVQSQAVTGGYSQAYIDATFTPKILNTQTDKATPVDADLIPLSDSASSFGLKKLSWANIKATLISSFGALINGLTAKATPVDADMIVIGDSASSNASKKLTFTNLKTFLFGSPALTGTPTAPTAPTATNTTQIATTAFANSIAIGVNQTVQTFTVGTQRVAGTTYTNSTGKPIEIYISGSSGGGGWNITLTINGTQVLLIGNTSNQGEGMCFSGIIPNGATYVVGNSGATITSWKELR